MNKFIIKISKNNSARKAISFLLRVQDLYFERRLNIDTRGYLPFKIMPNTHNDGQPYEYTRYYILRMIFDRLDITKEDVFADYGCGKGRVTCFASNFPFKKVVGLEVSDEYVRIAKKNAETVKHAKAPIEIIHTDAIDHDCSDITIFYFFNPFGEKTTKAILDNIHQSLMRRPRKVTVILYNPIRSELFQQCLWLKRNDQLGFDTVRLSEKSKERPCVEFYQSRD